MVAEPCVSLPGKMADSESEDVGPIGHNPLAGATSGGQAAAGHQAGSVSTGGATVEATFKDRDPPPTYDGVNPEVTFRQFEKSLKLWQFETDVPVRKQGAKLLRSLTGSARMAVDDLEYEEIASEDGIKNIVRRLREYYLPHLEVSLPRAFEYAVYGQPRQGHETFVEYVHRVERGFARLSKEGVDLPSGAIGYIMYRQASLTDAQDQRLQTWCEGKYDRDSVVKALRRLDKVIRDKHGKSGYLVNSEDAFDPENAYFQDYQEYPEDNSDDEFIFVAEGDLDVIYEEKDMLEALASYKEVRQALKDQKTNRGYYPGKGFHGSKGKGKGKTRIHKEQLKLRTKCWKCCQIGHISAECTSKVSVKDTSSQGSSSNSSKSGFFVSVAENGFAALSQAEDGVSDFPQGEDGVSDFWLRSFVARRAKTQNNGESEGAYKAEQHAAGKNEGDGFHGIVTSSFEGVVDTAAEGGLIGMLAFRRLEDELQKKGLQCKWTPKNTSAKGVGGEAKVHGVVLIPLGIGGINGILETTVVEGEVPLLLPIRLLKALKAVIDIPNESIHFKASDVTVGMRELHTGHMVIQITEFSDEGFEVPPEVGMDSDFRLVNVAMLAQRVDVFAATHSIQDPSDDISNGWAAASPADHWQSTFRTRTGSSGASSGEANQFEESNQGLEGASGQGVHHHDNGRSSGRGWRLVPTIIGASVVLCSGDLSSRCVRGDHLGGSILASNPDQGDSYEGSKLMYPPKVKTQGWRQCHGILDCMPRLQFSVGKSIQGYGNQEGRQEGELGSNAGLLESRGASHGDRSQDGGKTQANEQESLSAGRGGRSKDLGVPDDGVPEVHVSDDGDEDGRDGNTTAGTADGTSTVGAVAEPADATTEERDERASLEARGNDADGDEGRDTLRRSSDTGSGSALGSRLIDSSRSITGTHSNTSGTMHMQEASREDDRQEGRAQEGKEVLEVHSEGMRLLPVGTSHSHGSDSNQECSQLQSGQLAGSELSEPQGCGGLDRSRRPVETNWSELSSEKMRRWTRRMQVARPETSYFTVDKKYQAYNPALEVWEERRGFVPLHSEEKLRVEVKPTRRCEVEDNYAMEKETCFRKPQKQKLNKAMEEFAAKMEKDLKTLEANKTVSEVFSPPRIAAAATRHGLKQGRSYDLVTGWNLDDSKQVKAMWKQLKEDQPILIVISPPCKAFSRLQEWNFRRMSLRNAVKLVWGGLNHLRLAMEVAKWQIRQGRYFLFEHPLGATSWNEEAVRQVQELEGVLKVECDMCRFNLRVDGEHLNKKPTGLLTNSEEMARMLGRRCQGGHQHKPLLNGTAVKAQAYTPQFCEAVIKGLKRQMIKDEVVQRREEVWAVSRGELLDDEEDDGAELDEEEVKPLEVVAAGENPGNGSITEDEKKAVMKLHKGVGHPQKAEFIRFMRAARVKNEVVRWAAREFRCDVCEAQAHPKAARLATIPRSYQPNKLIGVDLIFLPEVGGGSTFPAINILDWGSNYQMVERLEDKHPQTVWEAIQRLWFRIFGTPEVVVTDQGKEFSKHFQLEASKLGIVTHQGAAKAPWQQGRTERHGAHFKELLEKARLECVVTSPEELSQLMREVEQAKNRFSNRSGFAPIQRQIGQWPRVPNSIMSDELVDSSLVDGVISDDLHQMRRIAQKAFVEMNAKHSVKKALAGRSRIWQEFTAGDLVYVYRVPRARKTKAGHYESYEKASLKATWIGPGTVIVPDGANLWVSMMGELWKVAREQCRQATSEERSGVEAVMNECKELIEEYKRNPKRAGYKDITNEEWPEPELKRSREGQDSDEEAEKRPRLVDEADEDDYVPTSPINTPEEHPVPESIEGSIDEPEQEQAHNTPTINSSNSNSPQHSTGTQNNTPVIGGNPNTMANTSTHPAPGTEAETRFREVCQESQRRADRLDGIPSGPMRWRQTAQPREGPYLVETPEYHLITQAEDHEEWMEMEDQARQGKMFPELARPKRQDYWEVDLCKKQLMRHHVKKRRMRFNPVGSKDMPIPSWAVKPVRTTKRSTPSNEVVVEQDDWKSRSQDGQSHFWWKGTTVFQVEDTFDLEVWAATKKGQDEVDLRKEPEEEMEGWKQGDAAEWAKIVASGAVQVLSLEESREIRRGLREEGKEDRILPTKMARRRKQSNQVKRPARSPGCASGEI